MQGQLKKTETRTYLCDGETTDWNGLRTAPRAIGARIDAELARLGLTTIGPWVMFYRHDKDPHRPEGRFARFYLELGLEVDDRAAALTGYRGPLELRRTGGEDCASTVHRGPIDRLPWKELRDLAEQHGYRTLEERELYVRFGSNPPDNEIELQCLLIPGRPPRP